MIGISGNIGDIASVLNNRPGWIADSISAGFGSALTAGVAIGIGAIRGSRSRRALFGGNGEDQEGRAALTMLKGRYRAFVVKATNHRERWNWRVIDTKKRRNPEVASGQSEEELHAISDALSLLKRLVEDG